MDDQLTQQTLDSLLLLLECQRDQEPPPTTVAQSILRTTHPHIFEQWHTISLLPERPPFIQALYVAQGLLEPFTEFIKKAEDQLELILKARPIAKPIIKRRIRLSNENEKGPANTSSSTLSQSLPILEPTKPEQSPIMQGQAASVITTTKHPQPQSLTATTTSSPTTSTQSVSSAVTITSSGTTATVKESLPLENTSISITKGESPSLKKPVHPTIHVPTETPAKCIQTTTTSLKTASTPVIVNSHSSQLLPHNQNPLNVSATQLPSIFDPVSNSSRNIICRQVAKKHTGPRSNCVDTIARTTDAQKKLEYGINECKVVLLDFNKYFEEASKFCEWGLVFNSAYCNTGRKRKVSNTNGPKNKASKTLKKLSKDENSKSKVIKTVNKKIVRKNKKTEESNVDEDATKAKKRKKSDAIDSLSNAAVPKILITPKRLPEDSAVQINGATKAANSSGPSNKVIDGENIDGTKGLLSKSTIVPDSRKHSIDVMAEGSSKDVQRVKNHCDGTVPCDISKTDKLSGPAESKVNQATISLGAYQARKGQPTSSGDRGQHEIIENGAPDKVTIETTSVNDECLLKSNALPPSCVAKSNSPPETSTNSECGKMVETNILKDTKNTSPIKDTTTEPKSNPLIKSTEKLMKPHKLYLKAVVENNNDILCVGYVKNRVRLPDDKTPSADLDLTNFSLQRLMPERKIQAENILKYVCWETYSCGKCLREFQRHSEWAHHYQNSCF